MKGKGILTVVAALLATFLVVGFGSGAVLAQEKEIVIGSVQDLSGPWSAAGKTLVAGRADYARYVNEKLGGVDGFKLKVITIDTGYNVDREVSAFKKFLDVDKAVAMINANSGAAFVINNMMAETGRGMPFTHTSEPTVVFRGKGSWYFGTSGATSGDGYMALFRWWMENVWKKKDKPKIGLVNSDVPPALVGALYAREILAAHGFEVAADLIIPPMPTDASAFVMQMRKEKIDVMFGLQTNAGWMVTLRDMEKYSVKPDVMMPCCLSDKEIKTLGPTAVGMYRGFFTATWGDTDVPGVQLVRKLRQEWGDTEPADVNYFWGWMQSGIMSEAIIRAAKKAGGADNLMADIDKARHMVRDVLENDMTGFDVMGIIPPLNYTPNDHRGPEPLRLYQVQQDLSLKYVGLAAPWPMPDKYKNTKWWLDAMQQTKKK